MARYIDADKLGKAIIASLEKDTHRTMEASLIHRQEHNHLIHIIDKQPTADVEEVKHGEWIKHSPDVAAMRAFHKLGIGKGMSENSIFWTCSCCDSFGTLSQKRCSECGAKMDGDKESE